MSTGINMIEKETALNEIALNKVILTLEGIKETRIIKKDK